MSKQDDREIFVPDTKGTITSGGLVPERKENGQNDKSGHLRPPHEMDDELEKDEGIGLASFGATSFAELEAAKQALEATEQVRKFTDQFPALVTNIMVDPDIEDKTQALGDLGTEFGAVAGAAMDERKERWQPLTDAVINAVTPLIDKKETPMKTEGAIKFPASDFAFVPDPSKPSTWKLRLAEDSPGNVTRSQLGAAAAAFSPGGFRGQRVQIPSGEVAKVKAKIRAAYRKIGVKDEDIPQSVRKELETKNSFTVWKQKDDRYRWLATYSNNVRDEDNPPEIISEASHKRFVKMVNDGLTPYPELWVWHVDGSRWGVADVVAYDDRGFAVATGLVDKGKEWVAQSLKPGLLTSHGMPSDSIKRDPNDPTIIIEHTTKEISPLPSEAAANKFTGFSILGDEVKEMAFTEEARAKLLAANIDPDRLEAETESKAQQTEGLETKAVPETEAPKETEGEGDYVGRDEVADLVKSVAQSTNQLVQVVGDLAERVKNLEVNKLTIDKETLEATPAASLADLYKSTIGSPETKIDGRSHLARSGPEETKSSDGVGGIAAAISQRNQEIERGGVQ